jgi:hypothetical protein
MNESEDLLFYEQQIEKAIELLRQNGRFHDDEADSKTLSLTFIQVAMHGLNKYEEMQQFYRGYIAFLKQHFPNDFHEDKELEVRQAMEFCLLKDMHERLRAWNAATDSVNTPFFKFSLPDVFQVPNESLAKAEAAKATTK